MATTEPLLTRYRVFVTEDGGLTLRYLGSTLSKSSDAALREFLPADTVGHYSAVNENAVKLRNLKPRPGPVIETEPLTWPDPAAPTATPPVQKTIV